MLSYLIWNPDPAIFNIGSFDVRWYGLLFALGFIVSQQVMYKVFKADGRDEKEVDTLTLYMVVATIVGARLGHVLFYDPVEYLSDPIRILYIREGGLASHGGAIGIFIALWLFARKMKGMSYYWILDRVAIVTALTGAFIRFGNFTNSEILGEPTESNYGVVFATPAADFLKQYIVRSEEIDISRTTKITSDVPGRAPIDVLVKYNEVPVDEQVAHSFYQTKMPTILGNSGYLSEYIWHNPGDGLKYELYKANGTTYAEFYTYGIVRHPAQLYESIFCVFLTIFLYYLWNKKRAKMPEGLLFGIFMTLLFTSRFLIEVVTEWQEEFNNPLPINMGQILSIPMILAGLIIIWRVTRKKNLA